MENLLPVVGRVLSLCLLIYTTSALVITVAFWDMFKSLPKTYAALRDGQYTLQENFNGTRYFMKKETHLRWWQRWGGTDTIIIFDDNAVKLLGNDLYLHGYPLVIFHPYYTYWRIRYDRLIKHKEDEWNKVQP